MSKIYVDEILPKDNAKITAADLQLPAGSVIQVQQVGGSQRTDFSATYSLNATIDVSSANLQPNTNYYFGLQVHANDQVNSTAPYKIGANGLTVLAAKK